ncbi:hypothetical protein TIFTF001_018586 [Ficus carica]|uniref:Endoplasmic reticulum vesicle transporter C-terminal domain-containing protein n=1 Tax=Ficus carica TaxID=3494 RepID=A0AA88AVN2_FICCA|nr:hypothetical protein TIFTF001_018586 [Ficus carica]
MQKSPSQRIVEQKMIYSLPVTFAHNTLGRIAQVFSPLSDKEKLVAEVREAYRKKGWALTHADLIDQCKREGFVQQIKDEDGEGCNIEGSLEVNKVAGSFHFAPGKSFHQANIHMFNLLDFDRDYYNISHRVNRLAFGDYFPGAINPLDG